MPDSFSELRDSGGSNRPWVIGAIAVLIVAVLAAAAAAAYALSRPASERSASPAVVTVTAQPAPPNGPAQSPAPGTYTGWITSTSSGAESGFNGVLTFAGDSAMLSYPAKNCALLLTQSRDDAWTARPLTTRCPDSEGTWSVRDAAPGIIELERVGAEGSTTHGTLSWESPV
ncbi:hypothetical protein [Corynebacterium timonense]|uniref:Uncharacterized protein n=1 Tax=Corynebacterium timonense TaxID=441500 RepID=A0A1H1QLU3_9CORY|nr:hypothetical protein [Corynebacterium timonense]SDS24414.1 hypothetical protein SAMN04488539_1293 [Corynebacterium timonense]